MTALVTMQSTRAMWGHHPLAGERNRADDYVC